MKDQERSDSPREVRRAEELRRRRADVLRAALSVFAAKGFHGAQMSEIASAAELSLASVYGLFESKDELYHAVVEGSGQTMVRYITDKVEAVPDPGQRLLVLIDAMLDCYQDHRELLQLYVRTTQGLPYRIRAGMGEKSLERYQAFTRWVIGLAEAAQRAGALGHQDPEVLAYALIGTIVTTCAHWVEREDAPRLTDAGPAIRALFRSGLRVES